MILVSCLISFIVFLQLHPNALVQFRMRIISRRRKWDLDTITFVAPQEQVGAVFEN